MDNPASDSKIGPCAAALRFTCYILLTTAGVASVAMALLAQPVSQYYADRALIQTQQRRIHQLKKNLTQHDELLNHLHQPAVLERVAVNNLNYVPAEAATKPAYPLTSVWPELENALTWAAPARNALPPNLIQHTAETLLAEPRNQIILAALGATLMLLSLACFYRKT